MTSTQRATWMRIIFTCAVAAVGLVINGLLACEAHCPFLRLSL